MPGEQGMPTGDAHPSLICIWIASEGNAFAHGYFGERETVFPGTISVTIWETDVPNFFFFTAHI